MSRPTTLAMPAPNLPSNSTTLEAPGSVIIVGANGSGKTRLGAWFEFTGSQQGITHRVAAQRSLVLPDSVSSFNVADAEFSFRNGLDIQGYSPQNIINLRNNAATQGIQNFKRDNKWQQQPATSQQNDYRSLLSYLFSEENEANSRTVQQVRTGQTAFAIDTKLQQIKRIWESILPHRQLIINANTIHVQPVGPIISGAYKASDMSDGERVTLYLIGQCLTAPIDSIIVADEPEVHLHRAVQSRLWNAIEQARPDCLFVYLTHDLDFAASRSNAKKIWIKAYDGSVWDWREVPTSEGIPEDMLLTVLGSRAPVLFTEGHPGGYEEAIFSRIYPGWTITPCGNCEQVIEATKSFTSLRHMHDNDCRGLIDRDYRTDQDVERLQAQGVYTLSMQEVENLMLEQGVLFAVLTHASSTGALIGTVPEQLVAIKAHLFNELTRDQELLATKRASWDIEKILRRFSTEENARGLAALQQAVATAGALDVNTIYQRIDQEFTRIRTEQDYPALIKFYNNKGLAKRIGHFFNIRDSYPAYFERLLAIAGNELLLQALRVASPVLPLVPQTV